MNHSSRRSCNSESSANISNMATQLQKAHLGSQPNLVVQPQSANMRSPSSKYQQERIARFLAARQECNSARTSSTPSRTPLPHEIPNRDARRASDPVRAMDPNYDALKRLQRFNSLNMMKPLPVPQSMRSLTNSKTGSNNTFNSSRSSIATDYSVAEENEYDSMNIDTDNEAGLDEKMLEDNDDMLIPDDMRRFLNERYGEGHPMFSYDPSMLTESELLSFQQGNNQNFYSQNSNDAQNMASQFQNQQTNNNMNANIPNPQMNNFFENQTQNVNNQGMNYNQGNQQMNDNSQMNSGQGQMAQGEGQMGSNQGQMGSNQGQMGSNQGQMMSSMMSDTSTQISREQGNVLPLSRENISLWNQGQLSMQPQNLPHPQSPYPPPGPNMTPGMMPGPQSDTSSMPPPRPRDNRMMHPSGLLDPNMNWNMGNMPQNRGMPNMLQTGNNATMPMMHSPHPPSVPKNHQMPMDQGQGQNQMSQGHMMPQGHRPHPPSSSHQERESPQVQVPHISQSQIPPKAKAANRNQMLMQQQPQMMNNQNQMMNMHGNYVNKMYNAPNNMQQQQYIYQQQIMQQQQFGGPMNYPGFQQNCPQEQRSPYNKTAMSPGCNQVTSSTDRAEPEAQREPQAPPIEDFMDNLNSISAENFMENINSISQENISQVCSPTAMSNRSASQVSRYSAALMNASNMAVNDMSSVLTQLAEENKYLNMRHWLKWIFFFVCKS